MAWKYLRQFAVLNTVGLTGYMLGTHFERNKLKLELLYNDKWYSKIPIFDTVWAAAPFSPAQDGTFVNNVLQIMKYGSPSSRTIRSFDDFILSYDHRNRVAHWVFEYLTVENLKSNATVDRSKCMFTPDEKIHPFFRSENSDYKNSGYDRGHLAAAGNHKTHQSLIEQTFYLSNMAPQVGKGFNRDSWNRLEKYVRKVVRNNVAVYCCTGPLYLPRREADGKNYIKYEVIGGNHVAVPTHFFKVLAVETKNGHLELEAYVMPNQVIDDAVPLTSFQVPPESIEKASGLLFFDNVNRKKFSKVNGKTQ